MSKYQPFEAPKSCETPQRVWSKPVTPDLRTREAKAAQDYMKHKGYRDIRPLGYIPIEGDECSYFYYEVPEGLIELEVAWDEAARKYLRKVASFITDETHLETLYESALDVSDNRAS